MKHINYACLSLLFKKIAFLSFLLLVINFSYAQCPVPFAEVGLDSTLRNVPVSTVVTRNVQVSSGSSVQITGDSLAIFQTPVHGTIVILNDSTIQYTPAAGFVGTDYYIFTICNSCGNCIQATVSIEVRPYCPGPVAVADHYTVYNSSSLPSTLPVTSNDQNIAGGTLVLSILHQASHGTATVSGNQIIYTSTQSGYVGPDTLVYLEQDSCPGGANADSAFVYLNVITCQPIVAVNDTYTVQQQATLTADLAANDQNVIGFGSARVTLLNNPKFGGIASVSGTVITYTAGAAGYGSDSIRYQICTDCGCDTVYALFNVTQKPCTRPVAVPDTVYAGYASNCTSAFNILANDTFPINGGAFTVSLVSTPSLGTATITNGVLHYSCIDSTHAGQTDDLKYAICNSCYCDTGTVTINITHFPCNGLAPVVNPDSAAVCLDHCTQVNVISNDYSPQGLVVNVQSVTTQAIHGIATISGNSTVSYCPNRGFIGTDVFSYQACDNGNPSLCNTATVAVTVLNCTAAPVILNSAGQPADTLHVSVLEDSGRIYCFTYTQLDSPEVYVASIGTSLDTIVPTSSTPGTDPCVYIAAPNNSRATQSVRVVICNEVPTCDTVLLIISVIPVDHAPVADVDTIRYNWSSSCSSVNILANDYDIDPGDHITITSYSAATANGGTISQIGDSTFCYTADSFFAGIDTFQYTICDSSGKCTNAYVVVVIPVQVRNDQGLTKQDSTIYINVTANDTRTNGEYISLCSQPQHGTVVIDSGNIMQYIPVHDYPVDPIETDTNATQNGVDSFCYTLCNIISGDTICANAEVYVMILPKAAFYIPQGISPNGDGVNDVFVIASANEFPLSQLLVYNRYGDEVWRNDGDGYQNDFNGTWKKNGQPLPDGSYWYIFKFNDGVTHDRLGYIVIQR